MVSADRHKIVSCICIIICFALMAVLSIAYLRKDSYFIISSVESNDKQISIKWTTDYLGDYSVVDILVTDSDNTIVVEDKVPSYYKNYVFKEGIHGKKYRITIRPVSKKKLDDSVYEYERLFLDYDKLPDLPILRIETENWADPTYDVIFPKEEGMGGSTIGNNEYVVARFEGQGENLSELSSSGKIKVRGNTSSLNSPKKSYKIELDNSFEMVEGAGKNRTWTLLNNGNNLKTFAGCFIGEKCQMEWNPKMKFVNVLLNGDWKGCYCLVSAVSKESAGNLVGENGCIFESDAYWWSEEGAVFRTPLKSDFAFSFKYPEIINEEDEKLRHLSEYMTKFESALAEEGDDYLEYIDEDTWVNWIMARDLVANLDGGGTNAYYYIQELGLNNIIEEQIKMGPLWDFDRAFETTDTWSHCRNAPITYFEWLFNKEHFCKKYREKWLERSPSVYTDLANYLTDYGEVHGIDLTESWELEASRWDELIVPYEAQEEYINSWMLSHLSWMNVNLAAPNYQIINISDYEFVDIHVTSVIDKIESTGDMYACSGWALPMEDDELSNDNVMLCMLKGDKVYFAERRARTDVMEAYGLATDDVGFVTYMESSEPPMICYVDFDNKRIFR